MQKLDDNNNSFAKTLNYFIEQYILPDNTDPNYLTINYQEIEGVFSNEGLKELFKTKMLDILSKISEKVEKRIILQEMPVTHKLKDILSSNIGEVVCFEGVIKSKSEIRPDPYKITYECSECQHLVTIFMQLIGKVDSPIHPTFCQNCGGKKFIEIKGETKYIDVINMKIEEPFENRIGGNVRNFTCLIKGTLAHPNQNLYPGDKVKITGILKEIKVERGRTKKGMFVIDVLNQIGLQTNYKTIDITEADEKLIQEMADQPDNFQKIKDSILPDLIGNDEIKEGILCQAFSVEKDDNPKRDGIHILLAGDPGTDKSQILKRIESLNFKAGHAVGGGTSEAGILGVAIRDEITGSWSIEPGLMPMCNDGIIAFDELDKTHHILLGKLNEAMEQQTVTITKAGSSITYPCRTLVLAALNPKNGHFDSYKGVREQIQLPDSVLDRFDLIYILQDIPNEKKDGEIVRSFGGYESIKDNLISDNLLQKYISYAKREIDPICSPEAVKLFTEYYNEIRSDCDNVKYIGPRDAEALVRIAKTIARIELKNDVDETHAKKAIKILDDSLRTFLLRERESNVEALEMNVFDK
jgi:replicative DNA helicase Mcm